MNLFVEKNDIVQPHYEFVERKGIGHPDTLADALAEHLSVEYSNYTLNRFGAILHHNFDKVGLLGGASSVRFGESKLTKPIRILINGRASTRFSDIVIPIKEMLISWARDFMLLKFPTINPDTDLDFHYNLSNQSSPGKTGEKNSEKGTRKYWFEPRSLDDIQETKRLLSNDTSLGIGYAPFSKLEQFVLDVERKLNGNEFKKNNPWIGSDIKIMAFRGGNTFDITLCIPQISSFVLDVDQYKKNLAYSRSIIEDIAKKLGIGALNISINTRDNFENSELYLTAIGSSIESGDEGLVGRGNRINGLITPMRPMSMEGAAGKNPVYHIGKIYYVTAQKISEKIYDRFNVFNEVMIASQSGRELLDPWVIIVRVPKKFVKTEDLELLVKHEIKNIPNITRALIQRKITIY